MRQSLSENRSTYIHPPEPTTRNWPAAARAALLAIVLSAVLVVVAIIDQTGGRSLADHVTTMYAPYGKRPDPSLLYGLVYAVAAIGALLWLLVLRVVRSRGRSAPILTVVVTTVTAALALLLLVSSEYGAQIFPPLWGILAVLPAAAGILAAVLLRRRSGRAVLRLCVGEYALLAAVSVTGAGAYWTAVLATGLAMAVAIGLWASAATATARHLTLTPRVRAVQLVLALANLAAASVATPVKIRRAVRRGRRLRARP